MHPASRAACSNFAFWVTVRFMRDFPVVSRPKPHDYSSYSDESHHDANNRYMVMGGILCGSHHAGQLAAELEAIRRGFPYPDSVQWKNISKAKIRLYEQWVDLFFEHRSRQLVDFNCVVFDTRKVDHNRFNESDPETGFFKFLFQHYLKHARAYGPSASFRCFHGNKDTGYDLRELLRILNASRRQMHPQRAGKYLEVKLRSVRANPLLQLSDVLIGATGFHTNRDPTAVSTSPKGGIAKRIANSAGVESLAKPTDHPNDFGFSIWHFELR